MIWFGAVLVARWATRPAMPKAAPATMDLRAEPPALVEFLVGEWEPGRSAVTATLIDLAARHLVEFQQVGPNPNDTVIRVRSTGAARTDVPLLPYEQRVLHRVEALATGGVVPAGALAQGTEAQDSAWWKGFAKQVVADAKQRGLSRDRFNPAVRIVLGLLALGPAALVGAAVLASKAHGAGPFVAAAVAYFIALAVVGALQGQRETPQGQEACAHWLGVRAWLGADEVFPTLPPASVAIWDRYLGYGAAVGVARAASAALPFGPRDEHRAWSTYGGAWHEVRLRYQPERARRLRKPGWTAFGAAFWGAAMGAAIRGLIALDGRSFTWAPRATESLVLFGVGVLAGLIALRNVLTLIAALHDLIVRDEIIGEVVRLRLHEDDEAPNVYHAAIDPGGVRRVLAWPLRSELYLKLTEGDTVRAVRGSWLGYTYSIDVTTPSGRGHVFEPESTTPDSLAPLWTPSGQTSTVPDPGELVPCDEAAAIVGMPLTERAQASTPELPFINARVRIYQARDTNGSRAAGRVVVQSATGPMARRFFATFARNGQPLSGLGDEAYARGQTIAARRGENIVIIRVVGAVPPEAPTRLAAAATARM